MARVFIGEKQHAKLKQEALYRLLLGKKGESGKTWEELAATCDESRQTFQYRFINRKLEAWEILMMFEELGISSEEITQKMGAFGYGKENRFGY